MNTTIKDPFHCPEAYALAQKAFIDIFNELNEKNHTLQQVNLELLPDGRVGVFFKTDKFPPMER